jgi:hypothetical protein
LSGLKNPKKIHCAPPLAESEHFVIIPVCITETSQAKSGRIPKSRYD